MLFSYFLMDFNNEKVTQFVLCLTSFVFVCLFFYSRLLVPEKHTRVRIKLMLGADIVASKGVAKQ